MMVINAAYRVLKAPSSRSDYDRKRKLGVKGAAARVKVDANNKAQAGQLLTTYKIIQNFQLTSNYFVLGSSSSANNARSTSQSSRTAGGGNAYDWTGAGSKIPFSDPYAPTESLTDILSDIWKELRSSGGTGNLLEDFVEFLESNSNDVGDSANSFMRDFTSAVRPPDTIRSQSKESILSDISVVETTISTLSSRYKELMREKNLKEQDIKTNLRENERNKRIPMTVQEMESRLSKIEYIKGLEGRLEEIQVWFDINIALPHISGMRNKCLL